VEPAGERGENDTAGTGFIFRLLTRVEQDRSAAGV
jgi:hypothetical protein